MELRCGDDYDGRGTNAFLAIHGQDLMNGDMNGRALMNGNVHLRFCAQIVIIKTSTYSDSRTRPLLWPSTVEAGSSGPALHDSPTCVHPETDGRVVQLAKRD